MNSEIIAYLDDSGTHDTSRGVIVAGCTGLRNDWEQFVPEWNNVSRTYGVSSHHNVDFSHSNGEYVGWPEGKRREYISHLIHVTAEVTWFVIGGAILRQNYIDLIPDKFRENIGDPYFFPFQMCIEGLLSVLTPEIAENAKVDIVLDQQKGLSGRATKNFNFFKNLRDDNNRLGSISFKDRRKEIPLQAADLIANEIYQDFKRDPSKPKRKTLELILEKMNPHVIYLNEENLAALIQKFINDYPSNSELIEMIKLCSRR